MTKDGLLVCQELSHAGVRTNVTLIFNAAQALLAAKSGATYISPFVGRIDDQGYAGTEVVRSCVGLLARMDTQVLAASIRTTQRVVRCFYNGADVVTMPPAVFWAMYKNVLTDQGLDIFNKDIAETLTIEILLAVCNDYANTDLLPLTPQKLTTIKVVVQAPDGSFYQIDGFKRNNGQEGLDKDARWCF